MADALSQADRAYDQVVEWHQHFEELEDPRQLGKIAYPLDEMLIPCLLAVSAGAESWVEIASGARFTATSCLLVSSRQPSGRAGSCGRV